MAYSAIAAMVFAGLWKTPNVRLSDGSSATLSIAGGRMVGIRCGAVSRSARASMKS
jgi:hypothetical protein